MRTHLPTRPVMQTPPQSMSVSLPVWIPSAHVLQNPDSQRLLTQSVPPEQRCVSAQLAPQSGPPQSMSLSKPFWMPSLHAGGLHPPATSSKPKSQPVTVQAPKPLPVHVWMPEPFAIAQLLELLAHAPLSTW